MRRMLMWGGAVATAIVVLGLAGVLLVDAPMPAPSGDRAVEVDCDDPGDVARFEAEVGRRTALGMRPPTHGCG